MATKSILKSIVVKDRKMGRAIVSALENSKGKQSKKVVLSRVCREIKGEEIKGLFGEANE